jgi:hypothetical protein
MIQISGKSINLTLSGTIIALMLTTLAKLSLAQERGLILMVEVRGIVKLKRSQWKSYQTVYGGDLLDGSDKLRLAKGASVKVVCDNLQESKLNSQGEFAVAKVCHSSKPPILIRPDTNTSHTRAGNDPNIPYVISPRNSSILTRQPILRWHSVPDATSYQVRVFGPDIDWKTQVSQPTVVYSGNQTLKSGIRYKVIITANNGKSNDEDNSGFTILSDTDTQQVKTEIVQLQQKPLSDESKTLVLAYLYASHNLNAYAIELLEGLVRKDHKITAAYQLLGTIYQEVGLTELARERYLIALKLANSEKDLARQAIIQDSLGEVDITLDQLKSAIQWFEKAQNNYSALGDEAKVQKMQQQLDDLKKRID